MTRKKKIIIIVAIAVVALAAAVTAFLLLRGGSGGAEGGVYIQPVSEVNAAGSMTANRYSGVIETQKQDNVAFDTSKKLAELLVSEGDRVEEGTPLFSYDTESTELEIQQAELEIERLNTTIANDNTSIGQLQKSMNSASSADKLGYSAQIQELQAEVAQAEYDIKTKQAEIDKLRASIDSATVCAKMAGTVETINDLDAILNGTSVNSDGSTNDTYITVLADGDYRVKGTVSEQNIVDIYEGAAVIVRSRVDASLTWTGTIATIDTQAEEDNNNHYTNGESASKYAFYVNLDSIDGLMLGQHVIIEMDYGQSGPKEGIWLNSGWLVMEGDQAYVWAAKSDGARLEKRSVELGEYDENMDEYQILSGLERTEYLAWPDDSCVAGAATTTEFVFDESGMEDSEYTEGEDGFVEGEDGGFIEGEDGAALDGAEAIPEPAMDEGAAVAVG